jgi:hypothetical protein
LRIDAQAGEGTAGVGGRYLCQGLAGAERERGGGEAGEVAAAERIALGFGD